MNPLQSGLGLGLGLGSGRGPLPVPHLQGAVAPRGFVESFHLPPSAAPPPGDTNAADGAAWWFLDLLETPRVPGATAACEEGICVFYIIPAWAYTWPGAAAQQPLCVRIYIVSGEA